jgi:CheY-like chemotaxis protein/HPt (histidine-containing phosphotransfer) domain-containing protein
LRQIVLNLAENAIKFTSHGEVSIFIEPEQETGQGVMVKVSVSDTGIGIPKDRIKDLFTPFVQADDSTTRRFGGTGLGLSISKQLIEQMGGEIHVESQEGKGSVFWFTAFLEKSASLEKCAPEFADLNHVKVLIVDGNEKNRFLVTQYLKAWGCRPFQTGNATTAFDMVTAAVSENDPFKIAILDMHLPDEEAACLGARIKEDSRLSDIGLIVMASFAEKGDSKRFSDRGFSSFLTKPIHHRILHDAVALTLGRWQNPEAVNEASIITHYVVSEVQKRKARILLVEDDITNQDVAFAMLKKLGYTCDMALDGQDALDKLSSGGYHLVLMDCQMRVMDGYEATRRLRTKEKQKKEGHLPVIAMTASAMAGDREKCMEAGMDDFISKPILIKELADILEKYITLYGSSETKNQNASDEGKIEMEIKDDPAVFDTQIILKNMMNDKELAVRIMKRFLSDIPRQITALEGFIENKSVEDAGRQAHTIKGAAANVGGKALQALAYKMEKSGKEEDLPAIQMDMPQLKTEFEMLKNAMEPIVMSWEGDET